MTFIFLKENRVELIIFYGKWEMGEMRNFEVKSRASKTCFYLFV